VDTAPLIYYLEGRGALRDAAAPYFEAFERNRLVGVTSILTLMELTVQPLVMANADLATDHEQFLFRAVKVIEIDAAIARRAAAVRARYRFRALDALQLATAVEAGASFFLTNDRALVKFDELSVVVLGT
jgi:predicted nucleic acid-binding protein